MAEVIGDPAEDVDLPYCEDEDEYIFGLPFWRIFAAMIAITLVAAFFYFLEWNKQRRKPPAKTDEDNESNEVGHRRVSVRTESNDSIVGPSTTVTSADFEIRKRQVLEVTESLHYANFTKNSTETPVDQCDDNENSAEEEENIEENDGKVQLNGHVNAEPVRLQLHVSKEEVEEAEEEEEENEVKLTIQTTSATSDTESRHHRAKVTEERFPEASDAIDTMAEEIDEIEAIVSHGDEEENEDQNTEPPMEDEEFEEEGETLEQLGIEENEVENADKKAKDFADYGNEEDNEEIEQVEVNVDYNFDKAEITQNAIVQVATVPEYEQEADTESSENPVANGKEIESEDSESHSHHVSVMDVLGAKSAEKIAEKLESLEEVTEIMRLAGLESSNLIFGIDYTASNKYQGEHSFGGRSLHAIVPGLENPYQQVIQIFGKTLAPFATSGYIPAFGFGDVKTFDQSVFQLNPDRHCESFDELLAVYTKITPKVVLSGPTNFAPLIEEAAEICKRHRDYHILVIIADGQVTNERATRRAIVDACRYPLSIIVVGVGDGPWDMMGIFDNSLPKRPWDNFHFVEFNAVMEAGVAKPDVNFAVQSLLEIPDQYKKVKSLGLLNFDSDE